MPASSISGSIATLQVLQVGERNISQPGDEIIRSEDTTLAVYPSATYSPSLMLPSAASMTGIGPGGKRYRIRDASGFANVYHFSIHGNGSNIDGDTVFTVKVNFGSYIIEWTGANWHIWSTSLSAIKGLTQIGSAFYFISKADDFPAPNPITHRIVLFPGHYFIDPSSIIDIGPNSLYGGPGVLFTTYSGYIQSSSPVATVECDGSYLQFNYTIFINTAGGAAVKITNFGGIAGAPTLIGTTGVGIDAVAAAYIDLWACRLDYTASTAIRVTFVFELLELISCKLTGNPSHGIHIPGYCGQVAITGSNFTNNGVGLQIDATATIGAIFTGSGVKFDVGPGQTGILASTVPFAPRTFNLSNARFTGTGTYLSGITASNKEALFRGCAGIANTGPRGYIAFSGGVSLTTCTTKDIYYPIAGTFLAGDEQLLNKSTSEIVNNTGITVIVEASASTGGTASSPSDSWSLAIIKNGNGISFDPALPGGATLVAQLARDAANTRLSLSCFGQTSLAPSDTLRVYIANKSNNARTYTAETCNLSVKLTGD